MTLYCKGMLSDIAKDGSTGQDVFRFLATSDIIDRQNEIATLDGWQTERFMRNPVFMAIHDYSQWPIGKVTGLEHTEPGMVSRVVFDDRDEEAMKVKGKYERGFLNAVSVGFESLEREGQRFGKEPVKHLKKELIEISAVPIPANPDALMLRGAAQKLTPEQWFKDGLLYRLAERTTEFVGQLQGRITAGELAGWEALAHEAAEFQKMGRVLSSMNERRLRECAEALAMASAKIFDVLAQVDSNAPAEGSPADEYAGAADSANAAVKGLPDTTGNTEIQVDLSALVAFVGR